MMWAVHPVILLMTNMGVNVGMSLGCDLTYADRLTYSAGIDLTNTEAIVPIGADCKICERPACAQRAFPYLGRPVAIDPNASTDLPYPPVTPTAG